MDHFFDFVHYCIDRDQSRITVHDWDHVADRGGSKWRGPDDSGLVNVSHEPRHHDHAERVRDDRSSGHLSDRIEYRVPSLDHITAVNSTQRMDHRMNMKWIGLTLGLLLATPAEQAGAQWQVPDHSVPVGRGAGTGFKNAAPGTTGYPLLSNGASSDPSFVATTAFFLNKGGTNQTGMTDGAYTRVTWSTAKFNNGGGTFSGNRWTAPTTGYIQFNFSLFWTAHAATASPLFVGKLIKNSAGTCNGTDAFAGVGTALVGFAGFAIAHGAGVDSATAGDVYEVCGFGTSDDAMNDLQLDGNTAHTHWSGAYFR